MNQLIVAAVVLLVAVGQVAVATAQAPPPISPPPPPIAAPPPPPVSAPGGLSAPTNLQHLPWFVRPYNMPGMPSFYRPPAPPPQRQCRVVAWQPAQFWNTDQWGNTVTWVGYQPQYACN
jgi:hypothetical protein